MIKNKKHWAIVVGALKGSNVSGPDTGLWCALGGANILCNFPWSGLCSNTSRYIDAYKSKQAAQNKIDDLNKYGLSYSYLIKELPAYIKNEKE